MMRLAALTLSILLLTACAENPRVMSFESTSARDGAAWPVWPEEPEVPRFIYAGELSGEANFVEDKSDAETTGRDVFAWLVGLGRGEDRQPVVLQRPQGGAVDAAGRVYVTDVSRQAVFVFDGPAGELKLWEWATPTQRFKAPIGVAPVSTGETLVTDAELGMVVRLDPDGRPQGGFGAGLLQRPTGMVLDREGRVYVADTRANDIKVFGLDGGYRYSFGESGDGPGKLNAPTYLAAVDDRIYVTDTLNSRVQIFSREGDYLSALGVRGLYLGNLTRPKGIAVSNEGLVYVIESYYDHLLVFDTQGRFLLPIGGSGQAPGQFFLPAGVWLDEQERVYVADMFNGRVSIFQYLGGAL
jgi:DNA-binding beta-propeller fold protein YncE